MTSLLIIMAVFAVIIGAITLGIRLLSKKSD